MEVLDKATLDEFAPGHSCLKIPLSDTPFCFFQQRFPQALVYIRPAYQKLADSILADTNSAGVTSASAHSTHGFLITGNSGVGKSTFFVYLLWRICLKYPKMDIVYQSADSQSKYVFFAASRTCHCMDSFPSGAASKNNFVYLFDVTGSKSGCMPVILPSVLTVVASSPASINSDLIRAWKKNKTHELVLLPRWSLGDYFFVFIFLQLFSSISYSFL